MTRTRKLALLGLALLAGFGVWYARSGTKTEAPAALAPATIAEGMSGTQGALSVEPQADAGLISARASAGSAGAAEVERTSFVMVHCIDALTRQPVSEVSVQLVDERHKESVEVRRSQGSIGEVLFTEASGLASFAVDPDSKLNVSAWQYELGSSTYFSEHREITPLAAGEVRELTLELKFVANSILCGRIRARDSREPIQGALVRGRGRREFNSDVDGRFEFPYSDWNASSVRITAAGFAPALVHATGGHSTPATAQELELARGVKLEVQLAGTTGRSALQVELWCSSSDIAQPGSEMYFENQRERWSARADANGLATFVDLPPGVRLDGRVLDSERIVHVRADALVLQSGEPRRVAWDLAGGCELSGRVRELDGRPASGLELWLLRDADAPDGYLEPYMDSRVVALSISAADGAFSFAHLAPGAWRVGPRPDERRDADAERFASPGELVVIEAQQREQRVDIVLQRGLYLRGKVVDPTGRPVASDVSARDERGRTIVNDNFEHAGFRLGPLLAGKYVLEASPTNGFLSSDPVEASAGASGLVLTVPLGCELDGLLVDAETGESLAGRVCIAPRFVERAQIQFVRADRPEGFRCTQLAPGKYSLAASTDDGRVGQLRELELAAVTPAHGLRIEMKRGARLRVRVESPRERVGFSVLAGDVIVALDSLRPGSMAELVVPSVKLTVRLDAHAGSKPREQELELSAGEMREIVLHDGGDK